MGRRRKHRQFGRLFEQAARRLWIVASASVPRGVVDDVLQEAAVVGLKRFSSFDRGSSFAAWMSQIVRHVAANHRRKATRNSPEPVDGQDFDLMAPARPVPHRPCHSAGKLAEDQSDFDDQVEGALRALHEDASASLLLHTIEGLTHREIGSLLDLPEGTVASHIHRARKSLRDTLTSTSEERDAAARLIS